MKRWLILSLITACKTPASQAPDASREAHEETAITIAPSHAPDASPPPLHPRSPAKAGERVDVPAGAFRAGSMPGEEGRDPAMEPVTYDVPLAGFAIDALPSPNDPMQTTAVTSFESAERGCAARGARLCSELEWERACKADGDAYATGASWDAACDRDPSSCRSGLGVRALGAAREWTASRFPNGAPVLRGGGTHRCAERGEGRGEATYRCCTGGPNDAGMPAIVDHPQTPFRPMAIDALALARIFAGVPDLSRVGADVRYFDEADVRKRSDAGAHAMLSATPLLWSPSPGAELLVATGRGATSSFVIALWRLDEDAYRLAASLFLEGDAVPVVLAYDPRKRDALAWTSAPGRRGEEGDFVIRGGRVVITQR